MGRFAYKVDPLGDDPDVSNPELPTMATPGTQQKLDVIRARYLRGLPLWVRGDKADKELAPGEVSLLTKLKTEPKCKPAARIEEGFHGDAFDDDTEMESEDFDSDEHEDFE